MLVGVRIEEQTLLFFDITINLALHEKVAFRLALVPGLPGPVAKSGSETFETTR